ncbi:MAG: hypothetical protein ACP5JG_10095 [Anaerolineae bacterium]
MHWLLSVQETFSLREAIHRSSWLLESPFHTNLAGDQLHRIEHLTTGHARDIRISQTPAGLVIQTNGHLSAQEIEEVSQKAWRVLRLEDTFDAFRSSARRTEALASVVTTGARLIRGATLLEDAVAAAVAQRHADGTPDYEPVAWVVDRLGDPLPSNPTFHAFPTAQQLLKGQRALVELFDDEVVHTVLHITTVLIEQSQRLQLLVRSTLSANDLASELRRTLKLSSASLSLLMLAVGRYDYIPTDTWARFRVRKYLRKTGDVGPADVRRFFEPWQPWGGLAYWLWDWTAVPASSDVRLR